MKSTGFQIAAGMLGTLIFIFLVGFVDWWLTSRQPLEPGERAIIREVWKKQGPLLGPSAPPYEVRVVENNSSSRITFFIQPYPFGCVEEIIKRDEVKNFSFKLPLWTKDTITQDPNDSSITRILLIKGEYKIENVNLYARNLDYRELPYTRKGDLLYPVKAFLIQQGRDPEMASREELFSEVIYFEFSHFLSDRINEMGESIAQKYAVLAKAIRENKITSSSEKDKFVADFLKKYPWYKLEPRSLEKLRENPEVQELFQKYFEAVRKEDPQLMTSFLGEIEEFFERYVRENPEAYDREKWDYVRSLLLKPDVLPPEYKPEFVYPFVEKKLQKIRENYIENMQEKILKNYGVKLLTLKLEMQEDLTARYPYILMQR